MLKPLLRLLGGLLGLGCLGWVVWRFVATGSWQRVMASAHAGALLRWTLWAAPVYLLGCCVLGIAWWFLQAAFVAERLPRRSLFAIYAVTQFGKYLPGNVGQYLGRYLWLRRYGIAPAAQLMATLGEAGFLLLAASIWAAPAANSLWPWLPVTLSAPRIAILEIVLLGAGFIGLQRLRARHARLRAWIPLAQPRWLIGVLPLHCLFFAAMAAALLLPAQAVPMAATDRWQLPAAAAASWIAGFLVVGAPGGLGVREMVFLLLMRGRLAETDALALAAAFRAATFAGDLLFLLLGLALGGARPAAANVPEMEIR